MPGNLIQAQPTEVMPAHLSRAFHEERHFEADYNVYPDGSSDRKAFAVSTRRYFTMQQILLPDDWSAMRTFYLAHQGRPFYFYNLRETVPPFKFDPSGQDPIGRYIVTFDGGWTEVYGRERGQVDSLTGQFRGYGATVSLGLREIQ